MNKRCWSAIMPVVMPSLPWMVFLVLTGCQFMQQDFDKYGENYRAVPVQILTKGDTKEQVVAMLGPQAQVIGSKVFDQGTVDVWEYQKWHASVGSDSIEQRYWLYFLNGKYQRWTSPQDWSEEARRIYESRPK